jgi:hypothetical protein
MPYIMKKTGGKYPLFSDGSGGFNQPWRNNTLLDVYPGASVAYSLRLLRQSYTGSAIRVRRQSDNAEQDIGFVNGDLDVSSLETFCSGTNGFIRTWYDQSGSNSNVGNTATASQPLICGTGSVIKPSNNKKPAAYFDIDFLSTSTTISSFDHFGCFEIQNMNTTRVPFGNTLGSIVYPFGLQESGTPTIFSIHIKPGAPDGIVASRLQTSSVIPFITHAVWYNTSSTLNIEINNSYIGNTIYFNPPAYNLATDCRPILGNRQLTGAPMLGWIQEYIIYPTLQTNKTEISNNIQNYYL